MSSEGYSSFSPLSFDFHIFKEPLAAVLGRHNDENCLQGNAGDNIYIFYGTMEDHARGQVEPKGEFFCKLRDPWMPSVEG